MSEGLKCKCGGQTEKVRDLPYAIYKCKKCGKEIHQKHCWRCQAGINSQKRPRCQDCGWNICPMCGACSPECQEAEENVPMFSAPVFPI